MRRIPRARRQNVATPRIQSVNRAFSLLNCLADAGGTESLPVMAARCGLSVATAHRLLATLESLGAVMHTAPGKYRIGMALLRLADRESQDDLIAAAAEPNMRQISQSIGATTHLGVLDQDCMVTYIAKSTRRSQFPPTRIGCKLEAYCSALGKVLLAALPAERQRDYLADGPFIALTPHTITESELLESELHRVARRGYAIDDCELYENLRCVAVPIRDMSGKVVAALSVSSPVGQLPRSKIPAVAETLFAHADQIGAKLFPAATNRPVDKAA